MKMPFTDPPLLVFLWPYTMKSARGAMLLNLVTLLLATVVHAFAAPILVTGINSTTKAW